MLKAIIVDDEQNARDTLNYLINTYCEDRVKVVYQAQNVEEGIKSIGLYNPDIVFLDIKMKNETGFDLLEKLDEINFSLIFTTAYDQYALSAFKFSAVDYLLKPIEIKALEDAVEKAQSKANRGSAYANFIHNQGMSKPTDFKIAISTTSELVFIPISEIVYCRAEKGYTYFYLTDNKREISTRNLKYYEELLEQYGFLRIHNSSLINLKEVKKYHKGEGGYVLMSNGDELDVSKRRKNAFLESMSML